MKPSRVIFGLKTLARRVTAGIIPVEAAALLPRAFDPAKAMVYMGTPPINISAVVKQVDIKAKRAFEYMSRAEIGGQAGYSLAVLALRDRLGLSYYQFVGRFAKRLAERGYADPDKFIAGLFRADGSLKQAPGTQMARLRAILEGLMMESIFTMIEPGRLGDRSAGLIEAIYGEKAATQIPVLRALAAACYPETKHQGYNLHQGRALGGYAKQVRRQIDFLVSAAAFLGLDESRLTGDLRKKIAKG